MNQDEFTRLFKQSYAPLVLYSLRLTNDQGAAEDIAEESFVKLWSKRHALTEKSSIKSYLYTIARNDCIRWIKQKGKESERFKLLAGSVEFEKSALESMIYAETMDHIFTALDNLPTQCRKIFVMHYIQGKKISEIAFEMGLAISTVKNQKYRGIKILQRALFGMPLVLIIGLLKASS